jgi:NDP-4-keto-2,6-dideoxyhexose 3-C-methyltransferase
VIVRTTCRVCQAALEPILSLGDHYVSDFPDPGAAEGTRAPLDLVLCTRCRLLQLRHTVPAELMYRNYWYRSGTNATMRTALADIATKGEALAHVQPGDSVLDVGCNDGTLLGSFSTPNLFRIGFDPAENVAPSARTVADAVVIGFFGEEAFRAQPALAGRRPRLVTSIAMFYDLEDPQRFVRDVGAVMDPDGLWIVQMSYLPLMLRDNELGNVCHEHLEYYSLASFEYLLGLAGFEIVDVELNDVNGGSLRAYIRRQGARAEAFADETYRILARSRVQELRAAETRMGLDSRKPYDDFAFWVARIRDDVNAFVRTEVDKGRKVYVYGASTKGNTVLQYFGLDHRVITAAAERNPQKWGKVTVGTRIPIVSEEDARRARPDYFLVLPWHFLREFQERERDYLHAGGRFILPAPHFAVI